MLSRNAVISPRPREATVNRAPDCQFPVVATSVAMIGGPISCPMLKTWMTKPTVVP